MTDTFFLALAVTVAIPCIIWVGIEMHKINRLLHEMNRSLDREEHKAIFPDCPGCDLCVGEQDTQPAQR